MVVFVAAVSLALMYSRQNNRPDDTKGALIDQSVLAALPKKDGSSADIRRVKNDILPPTNSWLSGMVLQSDPKAVFPMPLSFLAKDTGFEVGLPTVSSTDSVIAGGHVAGVDARIAGAASFQLHRYDKVSATLLYQAADRTDMGRLTLAEGSPYIFYRASSSHELSMSNIDIVKSKTSNYLRYTRAGHDYAIVTQSGATIDVNGTTALLKLEKDNLVTFYALPDSSADELRSLAGNEVSSVETIYEDGGKTSLEYETHNSQPTLFAALPYRTVTSGEMIDGSYSSIYGQMQLRRGTAFATTVKAIEPGNSLDLSRISSDHKRQLADHLKKDVAATDITAEDSYYAGKQLARAANLLDIAVKLDEKEAAATLTTRLKNAFADRLGVDYWYYDSKIKGVAAKTTGFGSEDFNDHHFHYGYFIYAASILGRHDADFLRNSKAQINLLVADIANYESTAEFPLQRTYDPYAGHSWAAGLAPFDDGNNQESSSEAIQAWNGIALWGELTNNERLKKSGRWLLANEAATARSAWRRVTTDDPGLANYSSPVTSLSFGGKRTYSTFFSDEANAKVGIQLIPLNPVMREFSTDGDRIKEVVSVSIDGDNFNVALGDYILMYLALSDPKQAVERADAQQDAFIDDGNSRTYMNAWIFAQLDK
ncbi:Glycosyl hydrolase family 81 [compost metagenome]